MSRKFNPTIFLVILCFFALLLSSCKKSSGTEEIATSTDCSIFDLISEKYNHAQLQRIVDDSGAIEDYRARYTLNCVRKLEDGTFRLSFPGENEIASVLFDTSGKKLQGWIYDVSAESSRFADLKNGDSLDRVMNIDPDGSYLFLYTGRDDSPKVSEHYCRDGYLITINYMVSSLGEYVISGICKEWI